MDHSNLIFLSYASPDRDRVLEFHDYLANAGFDVWMDKRRLKGGQNWDYEIKRALERSAIIVVFLSKDSVDRRGYAQREIKIALDQARDRLIDDIYLIPVMLDADVPIPRQLQNIQVIQATESDCKAAVAESISHQLQHLGVETARIQVETKLRWGLSEYKDIWDGLPGYDVSFQLLRLSSDEYPQAHEITDVIRGWLLSAAMNQRMIKYHQSPDFFSFGQDRSMRQNSWDASCGEPKIKERAVSVAYTIWWYGAGAAHPNQGFRTFAFTLDPVSQIQEPRELFHDKSTALEVIRSEARQKLLSQTFEGMLDDKPLTLDEEYVESGTQDWGHFDNFVFGEFGIDFLFSCYQVGPYAFGPQIVTVGYDKLAKLMHRHYAFALGIEHLQRELPSWPFETALPSAGSGDAFEQS